MYAEMKNLKMGIIPTRRQVFAAPQAEQQKNQILQKLKVLEPELLFTGITIEGVCSEGLLKTYDEAYPVIAHMKAEQVDAIFVPHCNFGQEEAVTKVAKELKVPVLVWGPRDAPPQGHAGRPTDTQCGMFATTKVLQRYGVTYSYIENCALDAPVFKKEFAAFLSVVAAVKAFRNMRIAVISTRPKEFMSVMVNEAELLEKFGVELVPCEGSQIISMVEDQLENNRAGQEALLQSIEARGVDLSRLGKKKYAMAAIELAILQFAQENHCIAAAGECWRLFRSKYGISPCFIFGDLTDKGLPMTCETDIHGAMMSAMAAAANRYQTPSFLADLTIRHPDNDNAELLWHCGPFPKSLKRTGQAGFVSETGQGFYEINHGTYTVTRFDGLRGQYSMFCGLGKGVEGPVTNGNYLWLETDNWVHWEKKFMFGPYIHHVTGIAGDYAAVMREVCRYLEIEYDHADSDRYVHSLS